MRIASAVLVVVVFGSPVFGQSLQQRIEDMRARNAAQQARHLADVRQSRVGQALRSGLGSAALSGSLSDITARDAFTYISTVSGLSLVVPWDRLQQSGIDPEQRVSLTGTSLTAAAAIDSVVKQLSPDGQLIWEITPWYVEVMTKEAANRRLITAVYPVGDLLVNVPDFTNAPQFDLNQILSSSGERTLGGGGGGGNAGGLFAGSADTGPDKGLSTDERGQQLADLIRNTIEPEVWREAGGPASVSYFRGNLVVRAPGYVLRQIGGNVPVIRGAESAVIRGEDPAPTAARPMVTPMQPAGAPTGINPLRNHRDAGIAPTLTYRRQ